MKISLIFVAFLENMIFNKAVTLTLTMADFLKPLELTLYVHFLNIISFNVHNVWCIKNLTIAVHSYTALYNVILRIARNFLETRENIKILTHPVYHTNLDWFSWEWSKKKNFFEKKRNSKWPIFQSRRFSKSPILEIF